MIEINLVPDIKQELIKAQLTRTRVITYSIIIGIISIATVAILSSYVYVGQSVRNNLADAKIKTDSDKLINIPNISKTLTIQNQLSKISELNNSKNINSRIFDVLGAIIPPYPNDVKISNLEIDSNMKTILIEGQADNGYSAVEVFRKTIEGAVFRYSDQNDGLFEIPLASDISTSDTSYGEDSSGRKVLRFTISFSYPSELFSPLSDRSSVAVIVNGNVTDSYRSIPIFVDRAKDIEAEGDN